MVEASGHLYSHQLATLGHELDMPICYPHSSFDYDSYRTIQVPLINFPQEGITLQFSWSTSRERMVDMRTDCFLAWLDVLRSGGYMGNLMAVHTPPSPSELPLTFPGCPTLAYPRSRVFSEQMYGQIGDVMRSVARGDFDLDGDFESGTLRSFVIDTQTQAQEMVWTPTWKRS